MLCATNLWERLGYVWYVLAEPTPLAIGLGGNLATLSCQLLCLQRPIVAQWCSVEIGHSGHSTSLSGTAVGVTILLGKGKVGRKLKEIYGIILENTYFCVFVWSLKFWVILIPMFANINYSAPLCFCNRIVWQLICSFVNVLFAGFGARSWVFYKWVVKPGFPCNSEMWVDPLPLFPYNTVMVINPSL